MLPVKVQVKAESPPFGRHLYPNELPLIAFTDVSFATVLCFSNTPAVIRSQCVLHLPHALFVLQKHGLSAMIHTDAIKWADLQLQLAFWGFGENDVLQNI